MATWRLGAVTAPLVAIIGGGLVGAALTGLLLSPVADRIERRLHRMGG